MTHSWVYTQMRTHIYQKHIQESSQKLFFNSLKIGTIQILNRRMGKIWCIPKMDDNDKDL